MNLDSSATSADSGFTTRCFCLLLSLCFCCSSCRPISEPIFYLGKGHHATYINQATRIDYPDVDEPPSPNLNFALPPRTVRQTAREEIWDLSLTECIQITLMHSEVIRNAAQFLNPNNPLLNSPDHYPSIYDSALHESGVLFGQRGVEAALSDFDTQFTTQMIWGRNETVQNNTISLGLPAGDVLVDETAVFNSTLQKRLANGGQLAVSHLWNYTGRNIGTPPQLFPSVYEGNLQFQYRQPLLAGAGIEYTRIAGPVSSNIQGVTGVQQGVLIAKIQGDMALADFERDVQRLLHDTETLYWRLAMAYQTWDIHVRARDSIMNLWRKLDAQQRAQTGSGGAQLAELEESYLDMKGRARASRDILYATEAQLRLLMGLPVNDGRILRPSDDPVTAEFVPDWTLALADALHHRPEIRRQKWNIRSYELQRRAAENLMMPRLDFVSSYQVNGFGDDLLDVGNGTATGRYSSAYGNLLGGNNTGWNLGLEFSVPLGRRYALAQVRSHELKLAKAKSLLQEQEVEISHEIAATFRDMDRSYLAMENDYNRVRAARERLSLVRAQYEADPERTPVETVLRSQQLLSQAELSLVNSLNEYNLALANLNYRTGRTLMVNNIHLMEGPWCPPAHCDAERRFEERQHAIRDNIRFTLPEDSASTSTPGITRF